jgi:LacI family repressor for deo operon, udp, cdd, tsx, nupC, and nupG
MNKPKIHTMKELSKAIGISRPTLARFFENESSVLPSTSKKIKERLEGVDYVYNFLATRQNRKSTGLIGVIIPHFEDLFFASLLDSIEAAARDAGFTMITQSSHGEHEFEERAVQKLRSMNVDGAIIAPLASEGNYEALMSAAEDFPIVFADSHPSRFFPHADFVGTNNTNSIGVMVEYLCRSGPAPIYLNMPKLNSNAVERRDAYFKKMRELGFLGEVIPTPAGMDSWQFERYGFEVMDAHFGHGRYVDATILCANDRIAIGAIRAGNTHGLFARGGGIRRGLRIAGHDDHPLSRYIYPALTTVAQQIDDIGKEAVDLLINRRRNGRDGGTVRRLLDGSLRVRESA